jgi:two-component system, OmpR family, phosphate regulon response regulator PhoB
VGDSEVRRVLLVEDDEQLRESTARGLEREGFEVDVSDDGADAIECFDPQRHNAVIVDLMMPRASGMAVLRAVRERADVVVVVMSGHGDEVNRVIALELGAADFVAKPVSARELGLRVRNALRRGAPPSDDVLRFDGLEVWPSRREALVDGRRVDLTAKEFELLEHLARVPGEIVSRATLLQKVWGSHAGWQSPATVTEHVYRLRQKLEPDPDAPRWIHTVRGAGYRFGG